MGTPSQWCKVASNLDNHPKIRRAGRNGREVFLFALRRNAEPGNPEPGMLPAITLEPWFLADQLMMPETEAADGLARCLAAGLLFLDGEHYVIAGWDDDEWGRPLSGAERTDRWRKRSTSHGTMPPPVAVVTTRDVDVTSPRHAVTVGDECDVGEERRGEEKREEKISEAASQPARAHDPPTPDSPPLAELKAKVDRATRKRQLPTDWKPTEKHRELAASLRVGVDVEAVKFRDFHTARASTFADWDAAFRTWLRNAVEFARGRAPPPRQETGIDAALRLVREAEEAERRPS